LKQEQEKREALEAENARLKAEAELLKQLQEE